MTNDYEDVIKKTFYYADFFKDNMFFIFGLIAHCSLAYSVYKAYKPNFKSKILYILGHSFITLAMFIRINDDYREKYLLLSSISGLIGHSNLFIYNTKSLILGKIGLYKYVGVENILFFLGQIGMFTVYIFEYIFKFKLPRTYTFFEFVIYTLLFSYYAISVNKKNNIRNNLHIPLGLVCVLYALNITKTIYKIVK